VSNAKTVYNIHTDVKYPQGMPFDVADVIAANEHPWFNQTLVQVNDSVVRLGLLHGEFHWHHHSDEDELFFVLQGQLLLDVEGQGTHTLGPGQGYCVPRGVEHRTRAAEPVQVLMMALAGVVPTGD